VQKLSTDIYEAWKCGAINLGVWVANLVNLAFTHHEERVVVDPRIVEGESGY
jgi:hypothetical protein